MAFWRGAVGIGSYSADPTGNMVSYGEQSQTVPLKEKNVVVKFAVEANSQTSQGKIIVAATIHKTPEGVNLRLGLSIPLAGVLSAAL
jgi:hypothetical protein